MPRPKKNAIFDSNFRSKKWILHLLSNKRTWCLLTSGLLLHCFRGWGYEGDGSVMSYNLGPKKCRIKVFVMFCYLDGKNGSLSHFADVEPLVLRTLASTEAYSSSQTYNQCSTSAGKKNGRGLGTKSSNWTMRFSLGTQIHVEILLTIFIKDQYDHKELVLASLFKKIFITSILS